MTDLIHCLVHPSARLRAGLLALMIGGLSIFFFLGTRSFASQFVPPAPWDKLAHLVVFGGFAALSWVIGGGRRAWLPVLVVLALGCTDETLQSFTPGRDSDWHDIVADLAGACVAVFALQFIRWRIGGVRAAAAIPAIARRFG